VICTYTVICLGQAEEQCRLEEERIASLALTAKQLKSNSIITGDIVSVELLVTSAVDIHLIHACQFVIFRSHHSSGLHTFAPHSKLTCSTNPSHYKLSVLHSLDCFRVLSDYFSDFFLYIGFSVLEFFSSIFSCDFVLLTMLAAFLFICRLYCIELVDYFI